MEEIKALLDEMINDKLSRLTLSNPTNREEGEKVTLRVIRLKGELMFQEALYRENKVYHHNAPAEEAKERILGYLEKNYRQGELACGNSSATVLISKKGKVTIKKKYLKKQDSETAGMETVGEHNRTKKYILEEGIPVDFLVGLGVQTPEGKIVKAKYDKFRQINRYLEFIADVVKKLPTDRTVRIIDFGCGKSYLTFAMYYYLHEILHFDVEVTGLDLKTDVINYCNELAEKYHYDKLHFERGDIRSFDGTDFVDMVVSLHACDTATDYALEKAVKWGARVILAVPCCQHEVNRQIRNDELAPVLKYGVIKERMSALITDAIRADLLEQVGYDTQILEFIDIEHTPKNLLIRAVRKEGMHPKTGDIHNLTDFLHVEPTLQRLLEEEN
jgi:SAM-dependent methyltransferase